MKRNVLITVTGLLFTGTGEKEEDYIDVITPGKYYEREGRHFLLYEEVLEGVSDPVRNRITLIPGRAEMRKSGVIETEMIFIPKQETRTWYNTPFGQLEMQIYTSRITMTEREEELRVEIRYKLTIGGQDQDCFVKILVQPTGEQI